MIRLVNENSEKKYAELHEHFGLINWRMSVMFEERRGCGVLDGGQDNYCCYHHAGLSPL